MSYCPFHSIRFYTQVHYYLLAPRQHQIIPIIIFILTRDSSSSISILFISVTIITTDQAFLDLKVVYIHFVQFGFQSNPSQLLKYILWYSIHDNDEDIIPIPTSSFVMPLHFDFWTTLNFVFLGNGNLRDVILCDTACSYWFYWNICRRRNTRK